MSKKLTVIYSQWDKTNNKSMIQINNESVQLIVTNCSNADECIAVRKNAINEAEGEYIAFISSLDELSSSLIESIAEAIDGANDIYTVLARRQKGEKAFFSKMYPDAYGDTLSISNHAMCILRGFLGVAIRAEKLRKYSGSYNNIYDESLILTKILAETESYGLIREVIRVDDRIEELMVLQQNCNSPNIINNAIDYYTQLLELKNGKTESMSKYIQTLIVADMYLKLLIKELPQGIEQKEVDDYLKNISSVLSEVDSHLIFVQMGSLVGANLRFYAYKELKHHDIGMKKLCSPHQAVFIDKEERVLRKATNIAASLSEFNIKGDKLKISGRICSPIPVDMYHITIKNSMDKYPVELVEDNNGALKSLGKIIIKSYTFSKEIQLDNKNKITIIMNVGNARVPLELRPDKFSKAEQAFMDVRKYAKYSLITFEKRYVDIELLNKEKIAEAHSEVEKKWYINNNIKDIDRVLKNRKRLEMTRPIFKNNKYLLVSFEEKIPSDFLEAAKRDNNVKVIVISTEGIKVKGLKNCKFGSLTHKLFYIFAKYEKNFIKGKYSSPFGNEQKYYEGLRVTEEY